MGGERGIKRPYLGKGEMEIFQVIEEGDFYWKEIGLRKGDVLCVKRDKKGYVYELYDSDGKLKKEGELFLPVYSSLLRIAKRIAKGKIKILEKRRDKNG